MTPKQFVKAFRKHGSIKAVARVEKEAGRGNYTSVRKVYVKAVEQSLMEPIRQGRKGDRYGTKPPFVPKGKIRAMHTPKKGLPPEGEIYRYMFSCAQNNTKMHDKLWENAQALADHYDAEIMISRFLYNRDTHVKTDKTKNKETLYGAKDAWWDDRIVPYLVDERREIAPGLVWCGEMNLSPTAVNPLSSMERYTGRASSIFPHVKRAMESVPSAKHEATKFMYTTGTVTTRNYIQKKAGQKAEFDHCFSPDTEFLTNEGLKTFRDTVGTTVNVWSGSSWERAEIKSFGEQTMYNVKLAPTHRTGMTGSKHRLNFKVTPDHTWRLLNGEKTRSLKVGDVVESAKVPTPREDDPDFEQGLRHGLIFGDGTLYYTSVNGLCSFRLPIHGIQASKYSYLFDDIRQHDSRSHIENYEGTAIYQSMDNFKEVPSEDKSPEYLAGFLRGWMAADAVFRKDGAIELASINAEALDWAVSNAPYLGYHASGRCEYSALETNYGKRSRPLQRVTFTPRLVGWKVTDIFGAETGEVMCAVVNHPDHVFTLAGGVLTGNCYGFLLVEVDSDGNWYCRQLDADSEGSMQDFDVKVKDGEVTTGNRIEAILWGDIHFHWLAPEVKDMAWGVGGMFQTLNPKYQFVGDILDFRSRNHHDIKDPFAMYHRHINGHEDVEAEVIGAMEGLRSIAPTRGCKTIAVDSNHDRAAERWLKEADWKKDPINMEFYMASALKKIQAMKNGDTDFHLMSYWAKKYLKSTAGIRFLQQDESFIICRFYDDGIEMGMHGHLGLNGARGSAKGFSKMGRRANVGHAHSARIVNGIYQAGTCSVLDMLYNLGPSNWSWSHVITYPNGKQAIVTMWENKWRA